MMTLVVFEFKRKCLPLPVLGAGKSLELGQFVAALVIDGIILAMNSVMSTFMMGRLCSW